MRYYKHYAPKPGKSALGTRLTVNTCGSAYNFETGEKISVGKKKISGYEWTGPYLRNHTKKRCDVAVRVDMSLYLLFLKVTPGSFSVKS